MSALRVSTPGHAVQLVDLGEFHVWCLLPDREVTIGGHLIGCQERHLSDPVPFLRDRDDAVVLDRRRALTEARRTANREAARRYRERRRQERVA